MNTAPKDIEELLEAVSNSGIDDTSKALIGLYLRDREALAPEYRQKAAAKIKEVFSKYPELAGTDGNELGVSVDELVQVYKEHKEMLQSLDLAIETTKNYKPKYPLLEKVKVEGLEIGNTVIFHGQELVRSEYKALQELAKKCFNKTAEEYFANLTDYYQSVYLEIKDTRITRVHINNQGLDKIPEPILKLTQLHALWLSNNQISKIEHLEQLTQLQCLLLNNNKISRIEHLEKLRQLQTLHLCCNQISKIENLDQLAKLGFLHLGQNKISKIENLEEQEELHYLSLGNNQISKIENLEQQKQLNMLSLDENPISQVENLEQQIKLTSLGLAHTNISIDNPEVVKLIKKGVKVRTSFE